MTLCAELQDFGSLKRCYTDRQSFWENILVSMHEKLIHRGGDASGIYLTPHAGLSHQRLSIRDITHGAQPMIRHRDGADYAIVYNGEIYNTDELIPELTSAGYNFLTTSDTEVILYAYMHFGASFVSRLNGIFFLCHLGRCRKTAFSLPRQSRDKAAFLSRKRR